MRYGQPRCGGSGRTRSVISAVVAGAVLSSAFFACAALANETKTCQHNAAKAPHGKDFNGRAHWYGAELHGHPTASGEIFDKEKFTAAHPSIPLGTHVHVRSVHTGKEVIVKINDRCPVTSKRVIDLSEAAARHIGIWPHHKSDVECTVVGKRVPEHLRHLQHPSAQALHAVAHANVDEHKPAVNHGEQRECSRIESGNVALVAHGHSPCSSVIPTSERHTRVPTAQHEKLRVSTHVFEHTNSLPALVPNMVPAPVVRTSTSLVASTPEQPAERDISAMKLPMSGSIEVVPVPSITPVPSIRRQTAQADGEWTVAPIAGLHEGL